MLRTSRFAALSARTATINHIKATLVSGPDQRRDRYQGLSNIMVIAAPDCLAPEAARIVGAGAFRIFGSVVLPLAHPALITLTILSFQGSWNEQPQFIVASQDPRVSSSRPSCDLW